MCEHICKDVNVPHACVLPVEAGKGHQTPEAALQVAVSCLRWTMSSEPRSSVRALNALNH